jgi:glycosyltransferase involved in cell wall biosynthesis
MSGLRLLHIGPWVRTRGGVETLLARHARHDAGLGIDSSQLALFDRHTVADERYDTLRIRWPHTPRGMRRDFAQKVRRHAGSVVLWHTGVGMFWLSDLDGSSRRIVALHDSAARYAPWFPALAGRVDGVLCLTESTAAAVRRARPELADGRVAVNPSPIATPDLSLPARTERGPWVIGHVGRLEYGHKRADRLVPFWAEIRRRGLDCRLEILSDGSLRPWLERQFRGDPRVTFHGWEADEAYWRRLRSWDVVAMFSEHEGGPITLVEAMAAGVLPVYPAITGSVGDDYVPLLHAAAYYPSGDIPAAARAVEMLLALPAAERTALRRRAIELARPHAEGGYERAFADLVKRVVALPRISVPPDGSRPPRLIDRLPFGLLTRLPESLQLR